MEIIVEDSGGLPKGSVLSIHAGGFESQSIIEPNAVIKLPSFSGSEDVHVELMSQVGTKCFELMPGKEMYSVPIKPADEDNYGHEVTLKLQMRDLSGRDPEQPKDRSPTSGDGVVDGQPPSPKRKLQKALTMRNYLDDHNVLAQMQELLQDVIAQRPGNPVDFMIQRLEEACHGSHELEGEAAS
jgi:hypothetical protein